MKRYMRIAALVLAAVALVGCSSTAEPATEPAMPEIAVIEAPDVTAPVIEMPIGSKIIDAEPMDTPEEEYPADEGTETVSAEQKYVMTSSNIEGTETNYFYDAEGRLVREESPAWGNIVTYTYGNEGTLLTKDENGLVHYCTEYDPYGNPDIRYQYITQDGQETEILNIDYENKYDEQQRPTRIIIGSYSDDNQLISSIEEAYVYNSDGSYSVSTVESWRDNENQMVSGEPSIKHYDANGLLLRYENLSAGIVAVYTYDDHGNVISEETTRSSNRNTTVVEAVYENTYDELGRLTLAVKYEKTAGTSESGGNQTEMTPVSQNEYEFDANGNLILERFTNLLNNVGYENSYTYQPLK